MKINTRNSYRRILSVLVALCIMAGLVPLLYIPASAANYWDDWTEISSLNIVASSSAQQRTLTGNYKVTTNTTITESGTAWRNGLVISGTATIYIAPGVTLNVTGAGHTVATEQSAGAGIHLPDGATLILRGGGTLNATGGRAGNGTAGTQGVAASQSGNNILMDTAHGRGGAGGGGAGAGIGGNGGNGGATRFMNSRSNAVLYSHIAGLRGNNGNAGASMGTLYVLDSVTVNATGGATGTAGSGGAGNARRSITVLGVAYIVGDGGGGGGGGRGVRAANIGGGGAGGGSGGTGGQPASVHSGQSFMDGGPGSGGAPFGAGGLAPPGFGIENGNAATASTGGAVVRTGGAGGNVGTGGAGGTVFVASTANIGTLGGGNTANGDGEAATIITPNTITYSANGGSLENVPATQEIFIGENITDQIPTRPGFTFTGWNTAQDGKGTDYAQGVAFTENENITLYAQWTYSFTSFVNDQTSANFSVDSDNLQYVLENHIVTDEDITNNNSVILTLTVKETDDSADGAENIIELSQGRLLQFFDITVEKQINNGPPVKLPELPVTVEITIDLSEELSGKTGYTVYRYHNGVQRIGTDTEADEFFTVSRGTGSTATNPVDQVTIHTRHFSTYAVVENIVTIDDLNNLEEFDVQARIVDLTTPVYKIDIAWGNMKFIYNLAESAGTWNPLTQTYDNSVTAGWSGFDGENNQITVTNHSNANVLVNFGVTDNFDNNGDVVMSVEAEYDEIGRVPLPGAEALYIEAFLMIDGEPSDVDVLNMTDDIWHRIGIITVTITPDGDTLTPLR